MVCSYWMGVSHVLHGRFLCTGRMFLKLPPAWYTGYLTLLTGQPYTVKAI